MQWTERLTGESAKMITQEIIDNHKDKQVFIIINTNISDYTKIALSDILPSVVGEVKAMQKVDDIVEVCVESFNNPNGQLYKALHVHLKCDLISPILRTQQDGSLRIICFIVKEMV